MRKIILCLLTFLVLVTYCKAKKEVSSLNSKVEDSHGPSDHDSHGVHLASWRWEEFSSPILFTGMLIFTVILKIIFHHLPRLERLLPESCVLIVVGILCGLFIDKVLLHHTEEKRFSEFPKFTANLFFNILLPPIIFDAALSLYNKEFLSTFASVIIFAVFGTLFNVFAVGYSLYGISYSGIIGTFETVNTTSGLPIEHQLQPIECLIFSSLISAVDPVAVLAIFEQIHVNMGLYFLVFGESLFNDGVTVVLYNTMITLLDMKDVGAMEIWLLFIFSLLSLVEPLLVVFMDCLSVSSLLSPSMFVLWSRSSFSAPPTLHSCLLKFSIGQALSASLGMALLPKGLLYRTSARNLTQLSSMRLKPWHLLQIVSSSCSLGLS